MLKLRPIADSVWVAPQFGIDAVAELAASGITQIINNRPDGEDPGQPTSDQMRAAAEAAGIGYLHVPIVGMPSADAVRAVAAVLEEDAPVVLYCRSGMRSTVAWALAMRVLERAEAHDLRQAAADAGYDLSHLPL